MSAPTHPAVPPPANAGTPVRQRIQALDVLRGFALCGILLVNVQPIANRGRVIVDASDGSQSPWMGLFADQRFFPIFSLLFGIGFALQLASATGRARRPRVILLRRLLVLLAIGAVHFLLWQGDILTTYAAVGLLVLLPSSWLPRWATAVLAGVLIAVAVALGGERLVLVAGLFLLGSTLVRYRVVDRIGACARGPIVVGAVLTVAAVPVLWAQATAELSDAAFSRIFAVAGLLLAGVYTCVVFTLTHTPLRSVMAAVFAPLGRMALTNYLTATVIVLVIAHVVGIRPQDWDTALVLSIAGLVLAVQWSWSTLWLRWFRYGPLEWLWRWATWASRPPLRRSSAPRAEPYRSGTRVGVHQQRFRP